MSILGDLVTLGLTFVGYAVWGPAGALIGGLLGSLIFPPPGIKGPRLNELNVQRSTVGAPIPIVYGTFKLAGNVIWSGGLIETKHTDEQGGLFGIGGQKVTTYTYSVDIAIGLCEGEITGIRRIWADSDLIFDNSDPETMAERFSRWEGIEFDDMSGYIDEVLAMSAQVAGKMVVYTGTETQLPSPLIESYEGAGNVPAFRGLAYLTLTGFALEKYGNRIPNFRFEVYSGAPLDVDCTEYSVGQLYPWVEGTNDPRNELNIHRYAQDGSTFSSSLTAEVAAIPSNYAGGSRNPFNPNIIWGWGGGSSASSTPTSPCTAVDPGEQIILYMFFNSMAVGNSSCTWLGCSATPGAVIHAPNAYYVLTEPSAAGDETIYFEGQSEPGTSDCGGGMWEQYIHDAPVAVRREVQPPDPCDAGTPVTGTDGAYCVVDGVLTRALTWTLVGGTYKALQPYADNGSAVTSYPVNPTLPFNDPDYNNQAYWEAAYAQALADNTYGLAPGLVYGVDYPTIVSSAYVATCTGENVEIECIPMSVIVADICRRAGLRTDTATQIDVSDLTSCVSGYAIGTQMSARDALGPLRAYGLWDCAESGPILKFIERGHAIVATLTEEELGVHEHGAQAPSVMEVSRVQEKDLPRRVRVHFANLEFDHEPSEQSASRITTEAVTENDVELPISMTPDTAAQLAEIILFSEWVSRSTYQFSVNHDWLALEPTDCVEIPVDGETTRVRITAVDYSLGGVITIQAQRDDDGSYVSTAVAAPSTPSGTIGGPGTGVVCPSGAVLLDIPRLSDSHTDAGFYAAIYGTCQGWACAELYRSNDGGVTYARVARVDEETTVGTITAITGPPTNPAMPGESPQFDSSDSITVTLYEGALGTITDAQLAAGQNMAAIGVDGRWVIIQFQTAVLTTTDTYELSEIIWGLNDTRHLLDTTVAGDSFVLLSDASLLRIPESPDAIGVAKQYKIVTCGEAIADVTAFSFTTHGLSYARPCPATVLSATTTAPPSGALDGDSYLLPNDTSLAGAWETHGGEIATWSDETDSWVFCLPAPGTVVHISEGESSGGGGDDVISGGDGTYTPSAWPPRTASYVTVNDETATLPNSVRVVAGDNITFVVDSTNALTISATGGDSSSGGDGNITPDTHPASPNAADDEFEYGSSIDTTGARFTGATAWASANLGSVSNSVTRGSLALTLPTEATGQFRGYEQTVSGGSWRYECKLSHALSLGANTALQGFGIRENGTGKMLQFYRVYTGGLMQFSVSSWTSFSAFSATLAGGNISDLFSFAGWLYVAIDYDGTDYRFETSENGVVWLRHASAAKATYFTTAADRVMVSLFNGNSGQTANGAWDWVRRVS